MRERKLCRVYLGNSGILMNASLKTLLLVLIGVQGPLAANAQKPASVASSMAASAPGRSASMPRVQRPPPRPLTPGELRDSAAEPGTVRPDHAVIPQIRIPLGKTEPSPVQLNPPPPPPKRPASAASSR